MREKSNKDKILREEKKRKMPHGAGRESIESALMSGRAEGYCPQYHDPASAHPFPESILYGGIPGKPKGRWRWRRCFYLTGFPGWVRSMWDWPGRWNDVYSKKSFVIPKGGKGKDFLKRRCEATKKRETR
ncbi:MAG: hypothetical protein ACMUJM_02370 [bacterium]